LPGFFAVEKNDMRRKLVAGNWKMNGSLSSTRELLQGIS
jgi:triosephosphate isomerase